MDNNKDHMKDIRFPHPALSLGTIVREWSKERGEAATDVVRDIAAGMYAGGLEQGDTWQQEDYDSGKILIRWASAYFDSTGNMTLRKRAIADKQIIGVDGKPRASFWTINHIESLTFLTSQIPSVEPQNLFALLDEFTIKREDFKKWCEFSGRSLPIFWFGRNKETLPGKNCLTEAAETLRTGQAKYCSVKEKKAARDVIIPRIEEKILCGKTWHHITEVRLYINEKKIPSSKEGGLIKDIKTCLKTKSIIIPVGKPPKI